MKPAITQRLYQTKGVNINVAEVGSGPELVLIHGWSSNWMGWTPLALKLAPHFKLYMIDMPGFGDSDQLPHYTVDIQSDHIASFITQNHLKPQALIGASLGTIVATNTLRRHPHLASSLILLGAIFSKISHERTKRLYHQILKLSKTHRLTEKALASAVKSRYTAYLVDRFINSYHFNRGLIDKYNLPGRSKMTDRCYVDMGLSAFKFHLEKAIEKLTHPTLIIYGKSERIITNNDAKKIISKINHHRIRLELLEKCGHNPAFEQPLPTTNLIRDFLYNQVHT